MERREIAWVVKQVKGKGPDDLDVPCRSRPVFDCKSYKKKNQDDSQEALQSEKLDALMDESMAESLVAATDALEAQCDALPGPSQANESVPDEQDYVLPSPQTLELRPGELGEAGSVEESMQQRFDRLSGLYGENAAMTLCGLVAEGWHFDPEVGQWKVLSGPHCPMMPAPTVPTAEPQESMMPAPIMPAAAAAVESMMPAPIMPAAAAAVESMMPEPIMPAAAPEESIEPKIEGTNAVPTRQVKQIGLDDPIFAPVSVGSSPSEDLQAGSEERGMVPSTSHVILLGSLLCCVPRHV